LILNSLIQVQNSALEKVIGKNLLKYGIFTVFAPFSLKLLFIKPASTNLKPAYDSAILLPHLTKLFGVILALFVKFECECTNEHFHTLCINCFALFCQNLSFSAWFQLKFQNKKDPITKGPIPKRPIPKGPITKGPSHKRTHATKGGFSTLKGTSPCT
jgi:hypothetical protein